MTLISFSALIALSIKPTLFTGQFIIHPPICLLLPLTVLPSKLDFLHPRDEQFLNTGATFEQLYDALSQMCPVDHSGPSACFRC